LGKARRPMWWRRSKLCHIGPGATGRHALANTIPRKIQIRIRTRQRLSRKS
jgi:hypothetical protein